MCENYNRFMGNYEKKDLKSPFIYPIRKAGATPTESLSK